MTEDFTPFALEREMSIWEHQVEYNISESGVHPMSIQELVTDPGFIEKILSTELNYPQTNGTVELREHIAALYPGATADNVLVTTGAAQANFTTFMTLLIQGDEVAIMMPNYLQIWGIARNQGLQVRTFPLKEELAWGLDQEALKRAITERTKLIAVCNPNNPTGHIMTSEEMAMVVTAASQVGAWILADEIYAGAERVTDQITPSFWGRYDRVLAVGSLSKAYGLPGLRLGWVVAPEKVVEAIWARQDYVTICSTMLANQLGVYVLSPEVRPRILTRSRQYVRDGYENFERWCRQHDDLFSWIPPQAAAIAFVRYRREAGSVELVNRLIQEQSTYVAPGTHFGLDHYLRLSFGLPEDYVSEALRRVYAVVSSAS
jgi:aspartate/methionine/tyrosine aminotransferase